MEIMRRNGDDEYSDTSYHYYSKESAGIIHLDLSEVADTLLLCEISGWCCHSRLVVEFLYVAWCYRGGLPAALDLG